MNFENIIGILLLGLTSFVLTYIIKVIAARYNVVDVPNQRSSHTQITPRGGGLAIVITWYIGISVLFIYNQISDHLYYALLCGVLLAVISLIDDVINLSPKIRLLVQISVVIGAFVLLKGIKPIELFNAQFDYKFLLYPLAIVGMIWFINLYNFLDGIDGYVSIEAIFIALAIFIFTANVIVIVLAASVLGFLVWNWPKAKIFMGDVGSTQLGFILVVLGIYFHNQNELSILYWLLLTAPFWFDATFTLFRRWRNKENISVAHKKHAYQRIVQAGFSHLKTDIWLICINVILLGIILVVKKYDLLFIPSFIIVIVALYFLTKQIDKRKSF